MKFYIYATNVCKCDVVNRSLTNTAQTSKGIKLISNVDDRDHNWTQPLPADRQYLFDRQKSSSTHYSHFGQGKYTPLTNNMNL